LCLCALPPPAGLPTLSLHDALPISLTTLGTPHRGTAFADWGIHRLECVAKPFLDAVGIPYRAFYDLTTASSRAFNAAVPDAPKRSDEHTSELQSRFALVCRLLLAKK